MSISDISMQDAIERIMDQKERIVFLESSLAAARSELADADRKIVRLKGELANTKLKLKPYLEALDACAKNFPDGYTIVDFQNVWLDQERDRNQKLEQELAEARELRDRFGNEIALWDEKYHLLLDERDALKAEVERLTPKWQSEHPPKDANLVGVTIHAFKKPVYLVRFYNDEIRFAGPIPEPQEPKP